MKFKYLWLRDMLIKKRRKVENMMSLKDWGIEVKPQKEEIKRIADRMCKSHNPADTCKSCHNNMGREMKISFCFHVAGKEYGKCMEIEQSFWCENFKEVSIAEKIDELNAPEFNIPKFSIYRNPICV